ncbi:TIR domain-containing protein [Paenibacillus hunanensis]|uniref:SEFIR domain-containing protein n=1 Tax=Paenibacillus hunanensis TaxID=539262 RepID=UPI002025C86F|nr:SEFIR domain-containing protein [Paenibacillus hunanensis]MCL9662098.1 TIR domain-containing protein [Paenibacillus hunanensis]
MSDKTVKPPKIFISYSWTSSEHENWVMDLAIRLRDNYVDVVLDKWDLKEGHDIYAFMESMVHSEEIEKVLVICDKGYQTKAEGRSGGVGTETQIISQQVYSDVNQQKFIPIVAERNIDTGEPHIPTYMKSRKYIDLSSPERFENGYEELLRSLFERPVHRKPALGAAPSWLFEDAPSHYKTTNINKAIKDSITRNPQRLPALTQEFLEAFLESLSQFEFEYKYGDGELDELVFEKIQEMLTLRNDYLEFVELQCSGQPSIAIESFIRFFEQLQQKTMRPEGFSGPFYEDQWDHFKFLTRELFLFTIVILIDKMQYQALSELLQSTYFLIGKDYSENKARTYDYFDYNCRSLNETRNKRLQLSKISLMADMLMNRVTEKYNRKKLVQADLLLYYFSVLSDIERQYFWFPKTYLYEEYYKLDFLQRLRSKRYIEKVKRLFEVDDIDELKRKIEYFKHSHAGHFIFGEIPDIQYHIPVEEIGLHP